MTYDADPLFHVMSRKFDEGGVKGLLLANLVNDKELKSLIGSNTWMECSI